MIHFDLPKEQSSIIKVIGVGGGGSNAVNYMHSLGITGVDFMVCNTDSQALALSRVPNKIQLGPSLTQGLGAGANPEIGRQATEESLDEIRKILEVNTKMAFITAGMGGGTGTGGAPIIANICREMGILTVGIVTTPFSYEGKKRLQYANVGIEEMKTCVDTLLVISNDKLRHQFGNLTMSAALSTADNVLATAAKCITDVINTTGQINVDFADVCTVMRNGGVAILGSSRASGEDRAQVAIEHALNSPLLDDNDIKGAKWVLININSKRGENEFTMDEVDTIQQYLLTMAGSDTDIILGLGYDDSLGNEIGITIIATGFDQKSATVSTQLNEKLNPKDDKIVFTLDTQSKSITENVQTALDAEATKQINEVVLPSKSVSDFSPTLVVNEPFQSTPLVNEFPSDEAPIIFELDLNYTEAPTRIEKKVEVPQPQSLPSAQPTSYVPAEAKKSPSASSGFLVRPSVIYSTTEVPSTPKPVVEEEKQAPPAFEAVEDKKVEVEMNDAMQLVFKEEIKESTPIFQAPVFDQPSINSNRSFDEAEAQKAKADERLYKLRNLSYNFNSADPNNEYENTPAYVRHNWQMNNPNFASVEKFYSSYAVGTDDNNVAQISTINTFLEGKKPD
jgi:cell division protein FtsZ